MQQAAGLRWVILTLVALARLLPAPLVPRAVQQRVMRDARLEPMVSFIEVDAPDSATPAASVQSVHSLKPMTDFIRPKTTVSVPLFGGPQVFSAMLQQSHPTAVHVAQDGKARSASSNIAAQIVPDDEDSSLTTLAPLLGGPEIPGSTPQHSQQNVEVGKGAEEDAQAFSSHDKHAGTLSQDATNPSTRAPYIVARSEPTPAESVSSSTTTAMPGASAASAAVAAAQSDGLRPSAVASKQIASSTTTAPPKMSSAASTTLAMHEPGPTTTTPNEDKALALVLSNNAESRAKALAANIVTAQKMAHKAELKLFKEVRSQAELAHQAEAAGQSAKAQKAVVKVAQLSTELRALTGQQERLKRIVSILYNGRSTAAGDAVTIPKLVHHIYKTDISEGPWPNRIWAASFKGWLTYFPEPEYEHLFWPDVNASEFFRLRCPDHFEMYKKAQRAIVRADLARYCILSNLGGIYADLDYEPRANFYEMLIPGRVNLVQSPYLLETYQNSLMASTPGHPYWSKLLDLAIGRTGKKSDVLLVSGPRLLEGLSDTHDPNMVHMLPCNQFQRATHWVFMKDQLNEAKKKHCKLLVAEDHSDPTLMGIHWGTVSWLKGSNDADKLFKDFHEKSG